jgi:hypothetical protein
VQDAVLTTRQPQSGVGELGLGDETLLAEGVAEAGRRIAADGVYAFLAGLAPALRVGPAGQQFSIAPDAPGEIAAIVSRPTA